MIGLVLSLLAGIVVGYFVMGPTMHGLTPLRAAALVLLRALAYSVALLTALTVATVFAPPLNEGSVTIPNLLIAQGYLALYGLAIALGAFAQQRRARP